MVSHDIISSIPTISDIFSIPSLLPHIPLSQNYDIILHNIRPLPPNPFPPSLPNAISLSPPPSANTIHLTTSPLLCNTIHHHQPSSLVVLHPTPPPKAN